MGEEFLVCVRPFSLHGDRCFQSENILSRLIEPRLALFDQMSCGGGSGLVLGQLIPEKLALQQHVRRVSISRGIEGRIPCNKCAETRGFNLGCPIFIQGPIVISPVQRRIQIDQHVALPHELPVLHMDRGNHTRFIGLNHLRIAARNDLAPGRRNDIDPTETGPQDRAREHGHDCPQDGTANG